MRSSLLLVTGTVLALGAYACDRSSSPTGTREASVAGSQSGTDSSTHGSGNPPPTTTPPSTPPDTGSTYHGVVHVTVTVGSLRYTNATGSDTLVTDPVAGATVEVPELLQLQASPLVTDAHGVVSFDVPSTGPYTIKATPPTGRGLQPGSIRVSFSRSTASLLIRLFTESH